MSFNASAEKREKSLAEQIIVVLLFASLMAVFLSYFFKSEQELAKAGFDNVKADFARQLTLIRSQWLLESKPEQVRMRLAENDKQLLSEPIKVNRLGWVISNNTKLPCVEIWRQVLSIPLVFMKQPVSAVKIERSTNITEQPLICRYSIPSGAYFEYDATNGSVKN